MATQEIFDALEAKLANETTSYAALQLLQSIVARKHRLLGSDGTSKLVFLGAKCMIDAGNAEDAGNALVWFVESEGFFQVQADCQRVLDLFKGYDLAKLEPCASVVYDPLHRAVVKSGQTVGRNANSKVAVAMKSFDELCANIFETAQVWRSAYRVCIRLGLVNRAVAILDKWSDSPNCYKHEKPLFFSRAVLTLLSEKKLSMAAEMAEASKVIIGDADNAIADPPVVGGVDSGPLACWHLAIILAELAVMPAAPRVDKGRLFSVLTTMYAELVDKYDGSLVELLELIGSNVFDLGDKKKSIDTMAMLQAMMGGNKAGSSSSGSGAVAKKGAGGGGPQIGGMDVNQMLAMLNKMGK